MKVFSKLLLAGCAIAINLDVNAKPIERQIAQSLQFGFEGGYYQYTEPGVMHNIGGLFGAFGEYRLHVKRFVFFCCPILLCLRGM